MSITLAFRLSRTNSAMLLGETGRVVATANCIGMIYDNPDGGGTVEITWASLYVTPVAIAFYKSDAWEPIDPKTDLEFLATFA